MTVTELGVGVGSYDDSLPAVPLGDPAECVGQDVELGVVAWQAWSCHTAWRRLRWLWHLARARAGVLARSEPDARVVAAASGWSVSMAAARLELAEGALVRLPRVGEAMRAGRLEEPKAGKFVVGLRDVTDAQAAAVVDLLIEQAPGLGVWELEQAIAAAVKDVDPQGAENRRNAAVARARVTARTAPSGAVELHGWDLDPTLAVPAYERVEALAEEVSRRLAATGQDVAVGRVAAQVFMRLLYGCPAGSDDLAVVEYVAAELTVPQPRDPGEPDDPDDPDPEGPDPAGPGPDDPGPDDPGPDVPDEPDDEPDTDPGGLDAGPDEPPDIGPEGPDGADGPHDGGPSNDGPAREGSDDGGPDDEGGSAAAASGSEPDEQPERPEGSDEDGGLDGSGPEDDDPDDTDHPDGSEDPNPAPRLGWHPGDPPPEPPLPGTPDPASGRAGGRWSSRGLVFAPRILRLPLSSVLGLGSAHGRLLLGALTGLDAHHLAWARTCAQWRVLLHDPDGHLEYVLLVRPPHRPNADPRYRGQVVELVAHTADLDTLDPTGELIGVYGELAARTRAALAAARRRGPDEHPARSTAEADRRFPGAELTRWIQARDGTCRFPMCTRPAVACQIDHTRDHTHGGPTQADNLGALSLGHHIAKHEDSSGWTVTQPHPGTFVWTAPTGLHHTIRPPRYRPLTPIPRPPYDTGVTGPWHTPRPTRPWRPRPSRLGRITDAAQATWQDIDRRARRRRPPNPFDDDPPF